MRRPLRLALTVSIAASAVGAGTAVLSTSGASAAAFAGGDIVVYQVGNGSTALSNAAVPVNLQEYGPGGGAPVQTIALPTADSGGQHALTAAGLSVSEGEITRSPDGRYLTVTGYDATPGTVGPIVNSIQEGLTSSAPSDVARTIARIDGNGLIDSSTALGDANTPSIIRSASTIDGTHFAVGGGNGGLLTTSLGSTTTNVAAGEASSNLNSISVQGTDSAHSAVFAGSSDAAGRLYSVASGTLTPLPGVSSTALPYGYQLLDLSSGVGYLSTGLDALYLVDAADRAGAVDKYVYNGTTWVEAGTIALDGALGLAAAPTGTGHGVSLAVTTQTGLDTITDPDGTDAANFGGTPVKIVTAPTKTQFRGVAIAPVVPTGPSLVVDSPASNAQIPHGTASIPFTATVASSDGIQSVTVAVDSQPPINATAGSGNNWNATIPLTGLADGQHTLHVVATDNSATHLQTSVASNFTITAPTVPKGDVGPGKTSFISKLIKSSGFKPVTVKGAPAYKGKHKGLKTSKKGTAKFTYDGTNLILHLIGGKKSGEISVTVAGKKRKIDLYSAKRTKSFVVTIPEVGAKERKVTIKALHKHSKKSKGYNVTLGWLEVSK